MKIKTSALVTAFSGKLGGSIFSNSPNGNFVRQNSYSQQPTSPRQTIQRNKINLVTQKWRTLTSAQKISWQNQVVNYPYLNSLGELVYYTAYQLFNKLNMNLQTRGLPVNLTAPTFVSVTNPGYTLESSGGVEFNFSVTSSVGGTDIALFMCPQNSSSSQPEKSRFRFIDSFAMVGGDFDVNFIDEYLKVFEMPFLGQKIYSYIKTTVVSSGNTATSSEISFLIW